MPRLLSINVGLPRDVARQDGPHRRFEGAHAKVLARRAPALGERNEEVLKQLGFSASEIDGLRARAVTPKAKERVA